MAVTGMSCGGCVRRLEAGLKGLQGVMVEGVKVGEAVVRFEKGKQSEAGIRAAVEEMGFGVVAEGGR